MVHPPPLPRDVTNSRRLNSWKEIADYLDRTVRTVQRWERGERLPVHRHLHVAGSSVHAETSELDLWQEERNRRGTALTQERLRRRRILVIHSIVLCGLLAGVAVALLLVRH